MKAVKLTISGKILYLAFTGEALFTIRDNYGGASALLEAIGPDTKESFQTLCAATALLAEQGELARREIGYDSQEIISAETIERTVMPSDIIELKEAIPRAISLGFGREIEPENNEVDLGLAELNQKKTI